MRYAFLLLLPLPPLLLLGACGTPGTPEPKPEPSYVTVDHILIGVRNPKFPTGKRGLEEARKFAYGLWDQLKQGADWAGLKRRHSEDPPPGGPYAMANEGVSPRNSKEFRRKGMVSAFGDVGFKLEVGEIGMADYDAAKSPFGFHLIKRVK